MYGDTASILAGYGLKRYEISNYAKEGFESRHNVGYWTQIPYLGFGLGASSYLNQTRWHNTEDPDLYLKASGRPSRIACEVQTLGLQEQQSEFMILGLRMVRGVSPAEFEERFGRTIREVFEEPLRKHVKAGTLIMRDGRLRIPEKYLFVSNQILSDFI